MPTIVNTYRSPPNNSLARSIEKLGETMFGPGRLQAELYRQRTDALARENHFLPLAAQALAAGDIDRAIEYGVQGGLSAANAAGYNRMGAAHRAPTIFDPSVSRAMIGAGDAYSSTPMGFREAQGTELDKAQIGFEKAAGVERWKADNTPVSIYDPAAPTGYRTVTRRQAIETGAPMVLPSTEAEGLGRIRVMQNGAGNMTPEQLKAAGSLPPADKMFNWQVLDPNTGQMQQGRTVDGKTDLTTGQPLPPSARLVSPANAGPALGPLAPDNTQMRDIRSKLMGNQELVGFIDKMASLVRQDPTIIGAPGRVQKFGQDTAAVLQDVINALGKGQNVDQSRQNIGVEALRRYSAGVLTDNGGRISIAAVLPELFKPSINELEVLHGVAVYKTAEALAGQSGRELSDRDVAAARHMLGDPTSWLTSSKAVLTNLQTIRNIAMANVANYTQMLNQQNVTAGAPAPQQAAPSAAPTPIAPPASAAPPPQGAVDWRTYFQPGAR